MRPAARQGARFLLVGHWGLEATAVQDREVRFSAMPTRWRKSPTARSAATLRLVAWGAPVAGRRTLPAATVLARLSLPPPLLAADQSRSLTARSVAIPEPAASASELVSDTARTGAATAVFSLSTGTDGPRFPRRS